MTDVLPRPTTTPQRRRRFPVLRTPLGTVSALLLVLLIGLAILGPVLWGEDAARANADALSQGPSASHPLGTDDLGRDIAFRVLVATRLSLGLALAATALGVTVGVLLGAAPTVLPRALGRLVTAVVNIAVAFPALLLALFLAVVFGVGATGAVLAIGLAMAPSFARLTQTLATSIAGRDFVDAARVAGAGRLRLLVRHILPNISEPLIVNATIGAGGALLAFAGLSFLGLGVQSPDYDWGRLLNQGLSRIYLNPAAALGPGVAVVVAGLAFNLFGETAAAAVGGRATVRGEKPRRSRTPATAAPPEEDGHQPVLAVEKLQVSFPASRGPVKPVRGVSFTLDRGEAVGVVGESGSGKSLTALALTRLIESPGRVSADRLDFEGTSLLTSSDRDLRRLLGTGLALVFQDPMTSFNPSHTVGRQLAEVLEQHDGMRRRAARGRAVDRLKSVRIAAAERRSRQYPHEFSGGMRQRAMIAMGLMASPRLVIADEPTTALDVTVQRQVLRLLARIRAQENVALLLISHDLAVVTQTCDRVLVMYAGRIVEDLPVVDGVAPRHPYTNALLRSIPDLGTDREVPMPVIPGRPPTPDEEILGCAFAPRCPLASAQCQREDPELVSIDDRHRLACWHPELATDPAEPQVCVSPGSRNNQVRKVIP
ncbi:MAG: dipeptide/oligopeptide/nickel ABC transporter permease/ATP-binding protein [Pseudonocardiaceae bacterium]